MERAALPPAIEEMVRRVRQGWTGGVWLDFKDGNVEIRREKGPRGEKQRERVD